MAGIYNAGDVILTPEIISVRGNITVIGTHVSSVAAHGATGVNVGTTNTQTLTNKTLDGAKLISVSNDDTVTKLIGLDTATGTLYYRNTSTMGAPTLKSAVYTKSTNSTINGGNANNAILWDTVTGTSPDVTLSSGVFTCTVAGLYFITFHATWQYDISGFRVIRMLVNGSAIAGQSQLPVSNNSFPTEQNIGCQTYLNVGDTLTPAVTANGAANVVLSGSTLTMLRITKLF
jgi:hypothetical protein